MPNFPINDAVKNAINSLIQDWINAHPFISWLISHPGMSLILFVFLISLFLGFLQAISSLLKQGWLLILTSPFHLFKYSLVWISQLILNPGRPLHSEPPRSRLSQFLSTHPQQIESLTLEQQERLIILLQYLENIHQQQNQLLQEVRTILSLNQEEN
ncbi:hypothetical protein PL8927_380021 [Planktothrix serta PCC 8927]|uniref:Uncharacterized protein n=1 Tax=Planktothrix serta PCC 8927 TaxID=671068 RepID=A0A7Z9BLF1_9CYAN|nr:hypothetical protein [Planktothrix serta]VXD15086.1 hypothetical protein PL8927_380021 [Planktothrix serta PCC 8927]